MFTLYARTHLYMGFELLFILTTLYIVRDCADCDYGALTWYALLYIIVHRCGWVWKVFPSSQLVGCIVC